MVQGPWGSYGGAPCSGGGGGPTPDPKDPGPETASHLQERGPARHPFSPSCILCVLSPPRPPPQAANTAGVMFRTDEGWLVRARCHLPPALSVRGGWRRGSRGPAPRARTAGAADAAADSPAINSRGYRSRRTERRPQCAPQPGPRPPRPRRHPLGLSPARPRRQLRHIWRGRPLLPPAHHRTLTRRSYCAFRSSAIRRSCAPISRAHCSSSPRTPGAGWVGPPSRAPGALGTGDCRCCSAGDGEAGRPGRAEGCGQRPGRRGRPFSHLRVPHHTPDILAVPPFPCAPHQTHTHTPAGCCSPSPRHHG